MEASLIDRGTILVVEDDRELASLVAEQMLPQLGYKAVVAHNGQAALAQMGSADFSLILLDLELTDINGLELLRRIQRDSHRVPTILITGHGSEMVVIEACRLGVEDYLIKPVEQAQLKESIQRVLSISRLDQERALLTSQLEERVSWLTVLSKIGQTLTSTLKLDEVLRRIVEAAVHLSRSDEGFLALIDEKSGQLYLRAAKNIDQEKIDTMRLPISDSLIGNVLSSGSPYRSVEMQDQPHLKVSTGFLVYSLLHVPLISKGKPIGVLSVDNRTTRRSFQEIDERLLTSLADYAAIALENAHLYQQTQQEVTERRRVEQALRTSEQRYEIAVRGANDGLWDWDLKTNRIYYSPRWKSMLGCGENEISDSPDEWFNRIHPEDVEQTRIALQNHLEGMSLHFESEYRILHKDGSYRWMLARGLAVRDDHQHAYRIAGSQTDISDRKRVEEKLVRDAFYDTLTNLPNRALLMDRLRSVVERTKRRPGYKFAVLFLDLDRFKDINDSLGHMVGDQLLIAIAQLLKSRLRATDTIARLGGDEFVILLEDITDISAAVKVANWIQQELATPFKLADHLVFTTASIGIVLSVTGYHRPEDILRDADIAMYTAKAGGKARYEIFDPVMRERIMQRLSLESDLRQALSRHEFQLFFQPILSLHINQIAGLEALIRWIHPKRGLMVPGDFIHLAEETGLIIPIDHWVIQEACLYLRNWQVKFPKRFPITICTNLSQKSLIQPGLVDYIRQTLDEVGLDARCLKVEFSEKALSDGEMDPTEVFRDLAALGVQVQIDGFGIGYPSINQLSRYPVSAYKINQEFIGMLHGDERDRQIVQSIVELIHHLGARVIATGVETEEQLNQLRKMGCEYIQGNLVSSPLDSQGVEKLLSSRA